MELSELLNLGIEKNASDIHFTVGRPPALRIDGGLFPIDKSPLTSEDIKKIIMGILTDKMLIDLDEKGEIDEAFSFSDVGRYRINIFKQKGNFSIVLRIIPMAIPSMDVLNLPHTIKKLSTLKRGLVLVTGSTGSGKSTTLASLIDKINNERNCHILTLEDPIEYIHNHKKSIVNQREIGKDSISFLSALRSSLRQDPDIILVGEMRDLETISTVLTAAETGHLVISTLHTSGAAKTIDRIIDVFPSQQQQQIRTQLSSVLQAIISQQLLPSIEGKGRVAAFEIMMMTSAIRNLIKENKTNQIDTAIQTGANLGMMTMDSNILNLYRDGYINKKVAMQYAIDKNYINKYII